MRNPVHQLLFENFFKRSENPIVRKLISKFTRSGNFSPLLIPIVLFNKHTLGALSCAPGHFSLLLGRGLKAPVRKLMVRKRIISYLLLIIYCDHLVYEERHQLLSSCWLGCTV